MNLVEPSDLYEFAYLNLVIVGKNLDGSNVLNDSNILQRLFLWISLYFPSLTLNYICLTMICIHFCLYDAVKRRLECLCKHTNTRRQISDYKSFPKVSFWKIFSHTLQLFVAYGSLFVQWSSNFVLTFSFHLDNIKFLS